MFPSYQSAEELAQNLIDVGCNEKTITYILSCLLHGDKAESLCKLEERRAELLRDIHKKCSVIEYLDGLLDSLRASTG